MPGPGFWNLGEALKCVQGGESHIGKLRKPEVVKALTALAWFVRTLPDALALLQEVRSLAGRVTDGIDKPGTAGYVDHPRQALLAQAGLSPYSYTRSLMASGIPYAGLPRPGHKTPDSFVPELMAPAAEGADRKRAAEASEGAVAARAGDEDEESLLFSLGDDELPGLSLLDPAKALAAREHDEEAGGAAGDGGENPFPIPAGQEDAAAGGDGRVKVSTSDALDDPARVGGVDDSASNAGNVCTPAATDPLVVAGGTLGRMSAGQSQAQAGSQVLGGHSAGRQKFKKSRICKSVRGNGHCKDKDCGKEHPLR